METYCGATVDGGLCLKPESDEGGESEFIATMKSIESGLDARARHTIVQLASARRTRPGAGSRGCRCAATGCPETRTR